MFENKMAKLEDIIRAEAWAKDSLYIKQAVTNADFEEIFNRTPRLREGLLRVCAKLKEEVNPEFKED